jgi:hypothetical protein
MKDGICSVIGRAWVLRICKANVASAQMQNMDAQICADKFVLSCNI